MKDISYHVPKGTVNSERTIKKSRFVATVGRARNPAAAREFVARVRDRHTGASHNCYAFVACAPDGTDTGFGDDGEVSGTAGKPMLSLLENSGIGEIVAVVSRYYGGTKLGTGGLVRAYSGTLRSALSELSVKLQVPVRPGRVTFSPAHENSIRILLRKAGVTITEVEREEMISFKIEVPAAMAEVLEEKISSRTRGEHVIEWTGKF